MKDARDRVVLAILILAATLVVVMSDFSRSTLPKVHAKEEGCSLATLKASYGFSFEGLFTSNAVPATISAFTPVAGIGLITFDGAGNLSGSETVSFGGAINPTPLTGTYLVNPNCTGSMTLTLSAGGFVFHLDFVIVDDAKEIRATTADAGVVAVNTFIRQ